MEYSKDQVRAFKKMKRDFLFSINSFSYEKDRSKFLELLDTSKLELGDIVALDSIIMQFCISLLSTRKKELYEPMGTYNLLSRQSYRMGRREEGFEYRKMMIEHDLISRGSANSSYLSEFRILANCKCEYCTSQHDKSFPGGNLNLLTDLPHKECTGDYGCTCIYTYQHLRDEEEKLVRNPEYIEQETFVKKNNAGCAGVIVMFFLMSFLVAGISLL